ncbi:hypothetical protein [Spongiactinospora sp. TRM90649]|uniref:hypothetical protein n=1 Tax=Spongiactinospora sp. TRM90649 TaxID=3031114 RepID=UPI0023F75B5D|nr:hypothetical protein [Spongiactinospora sp. TRM90649]MDF5751883.1 hypothetical protein [Spongiactinospora sp. TRM90649]
MTAPPLTPVPSGNDPGGAQASTTAVMGRPTTLPERPAPEPRAPRRRTVPGRIRTLAGVCLLAVALLFGGTFWAIGNVRDGLQVIGHDAGPQVVATADMYFALSDMDAQVANVLLIGRDTGLGEGRDTAVQRYEQRRTEVGKALLLASDLAMGDPTEKLTVVALLNGFGRYQQLAERAMLLNQQADHAAGPPPTRVIEVYREATDLMRLDLLPKAYNLTLESGTIVRQTYEDEHAAITAGRIIVGVVGLGAVLTLVGIQVFLTRRFRRLTNPALMLATVGVGALTVLAVLLLGAQAEGLRKAKEEGFNSVLAMSRARAIGNTMHGDQSRYLLDPERADTYEQVYLDNSQKVLYTPGGSLDKYYAGVNKAVSAFPGQAGFLGFHGVEAATVTRSDERTAVGKVLKGYQGFQRGDQEMRRLALGGQRGKAIGHRMGYLSQTFQSYDTALVDLIKLHRTTFNDQIKSGDSALGGWNWLLPGVALAAAALILAGVQPRLSEYR